MRAESLEKLYIKQKCEFTRSLRRSMTKEEKILWIVLRGRRSRNVKFRRQVNIGLFIADFLCKELKIIIEVDGGIHQTQEQIEHDSERDLFLKENGYTVIRITNEEIRNSLSAVLEWIHAMINKIKKQ